MIAISDLWSATQERVVKYFIQRRNTMAEVVENNKNRWDAGAGMTALGIIGTTLIVNRQAAI